MNVAIVNGFDTYEPRVKMLYDYFVGEGYKTKVYTTNYKHREKEVRENPPKDYIYIKTKPYRKNISTRRIASHISFSKQIYKAIEKQKIDLLWVLLPPNSLAKKASNYKKQNPHTKLVFDIIDMWPETMPVRGFERTKLAKRWKKIRNDNLTSADLIVTECDLYSEKLDKSLSDKIKTLRYPKNSSPLSPKTTEPVDSISLCYLGSINSIIDIDKIAIVVHNFQKQKPVTLHIIGDGERSQELIEKVEMTGASVINHGKIYDEDKKRAIFDSCHFGLNIMKENVFVGLTMKSIDYFNAGLPIINNIKGDTKALLEQYGAGLQYSSTISFKYDEAMRKASKQLFEKELSETIFKEKVGQILSTLLRPPEKVALFVHDGPIYKDVDGIYCSTTITEEMLSRYYCVSDKIVVLTRVFNIDKTHREANLQPIGSPKIKIAELGNVASIKGMLTKKKTKQLVEPYVLQSDLIFLRLPGIACNIVANLCKKHHKGYLVEVGGCAWDAYWNHSIMGKIAAPFMEYGQKKTTKNASYATYVTHEWLQKRYPCRCVSAEASNVYLPASNEKTLLKRQNKIAKYRDCKHLIIGTIADVDVRYKGQEYIIKAIAKAKESGYHFKYQLVGGGDKTFLTNLAKRYDVEKEVQFIGRLLHEDVIKWLDAIDIYAQPSRQEGLPRSMIEAMSRGVPSIGSATGGIPELLNEEYVFKNGNIRQIVDILAHLDKEKLLKCSKNNYAKALKFDKKQLDNIRTNYYTNYAKTLNDGTK